MIHLLFILAHLAQIVLASASNSTSSSGSQPVCDATTRSVWSILGSCAVTLLICIWRAVHFDIHNSKDESRGLSVGLVLFCIFVPELVVGIAMREWWEARRRVTAFHKEGYQWSMTHSFFAEMGGFVYRDDGGKTRTIDSLEFLKLCKENKIVNPHITVEQIKALSKSDALGKTIFVLQLLWFTLQVVVRGSYGLAVTLVELDTVSVAALTLVLLWLWWEKPHHAECPHTFYYLPPEIESYPQTDLKTVWKAEPSHLNRLMACFSCRRKTRTTTGEEEIGLVGTDKSVRDLYDRLVPAESHGGGVTLISTCGTWLVLGGLHLIAWNFHFPTVAEKILWRIASLVLAAGSLVVLVAMFLNGFLKIFFGEIDDFAGSSGNMVLVCALILGAISRALLLSLMLASLRSLPHSAYQTVSWTAYIPHL